MERFWNIVHYFAYRADYYLHSAFNKIEPVGLIFRLLFMIPYIRNAYLRKGYTLERLNKTVDDAFKRPDIGLSTIFAGGLMYGLLFFYFIELLFLAFIAFSIEKPKSFEPIFVLMVLFSIFSFSFSNILLFRKDKYLNYFNEFDKKSRKWKLKWGCISAIVILTPFILFFWAIL